MTADPLDELLQEPASAAPKWPSGAARGVGKVRYTHDGMVDLIIANPAVSQNELAAHFGYSPSWVSQIIASDAFQARLAERTGELVDPTIRATVEERFRGLVLRSLEILNEKLARPSNCIPDNLALRSLEIASRAAGYGARNETTQVQVNVENRLEVLGENLTKLLQKRKAEVVDVQPERTAGLASIPPDLLDQRIPA